MPVRDRLTGHMRPIRIRRVISIASNLRQIAEPHRYRSPGRNSHLFNTHRYQLTTASLIAAQNVTGHTVLSLPRVSDPGQVGTVAGFGDGAVSARPSVRQCRWSILYTRDEARNW